MIKNIFLLTLIALGSLVKLWANPIIVTIDAGHGGRDVGAINERLDLNEKTLTLQMAKVLKGYFDRDPHFKVVMTRERDKTVSLQERAPIAYKNNSDIFISLHVNYSWHNKINGVDVFVQSPNRIHREVKNRWSKKEEIDKINLGFLEHDLNKSNTLNSFLLNSLLDSVYEESKIMAFEVLSAFERSRISLHDKSERSLQQKVKEQALQVLIAPNLVSILVETGYITNDAEAKRLRDSNYQKKLMKAVYDGVKAYVAKQKPNLISLRKVRQPVAPLAVKSTASKPLAQASKRTTQPKVYLVQQGDTLYSISRKLKVSVERLKQVNNLHDNTIYRGQELRLP